jgi:hypothetical protein
MKTDAITVSGERNRPGSSPPGVWEGRAEALNPTARRTSRSLLVGSSLASRRAFTPVVILDPPAHVSPGDHLKPDQMLQRRVV